MEFAVRFWKNGITRNLLVGIFVCLFFFNTPLETEGAVLRASVHPEAHAAAEFVLSATSVFSNVQSLYSSFFTMLASGKTYRETLEQFLQNDSPEGMIQLLTPAGEKLFKNWPETSLDAGGETMTWNLIPANFYILSNSLEGIGIFSPPDISPEFKRHMVESRTIFPIGAFTFKIDGNVRRAMGDLFPVALQRLLSLFSNLTYDEDEKSLKLIIFPGIKTLEQFIEQSRITP